MRPSSFAQAMIEPVSEIDPISAPTVPSTNCVLVEGLPAANSNSSTAPIAAAEPPPMPLYSATICGMSVIATRLPDTQAAIVPSDTASAISPRLCMPLS